MRRAPARIAVTDFSGSGAPWENGRTESWKVPKVALPAQPTGLAAVAGAPVADSGNARSNAVTIRFTIVRRAELEKSRSYTDGTASTLTNITGAAAFQSC